MIMLLYAIFDCCHLESKDNSWTLPLETKTVLTHYNQHAEPGYPVDAQTVVALFTTAVVVELTCSTLAQYRVQTTTNKKKVQTNQTNEDTNADNCYCYKYISRDVPNW